MRGRDLYNLTKRPLFLLTLMFRVLPRSLAAGLWPLFHIAPGILGVGLRYALAKRLAANVGTSVYFGPNITIIGWDRLHIGNNVSIHRNCYIDASGGIWIGADVSIAHASSLVSFNHTWNDETLPIRSNPLLHEPIRILDDVWIGCGVRILAGTTIGSRSVAAAGCVVSGNFEGNSIIAGVPARKIKDI